MSSIELILYKVLDESQSMSRLNVQHAKKTES